MISIAFLNFSGISVTKELSATTRVVLGNLRTIIVWLITLLLQWQVFHVLQLVGFACLIIGTCVYNNIIFAPMIDKIRNRNKTTLNVNDDESTPILSTSNSSS